MSITKLADQNGPEVGEQVTYTITVSNAGPMNATGVEVVDALPAGLSFASASGCTAPSNGDPNCSLGDIPAGGSKSYTVIVDVLDTGAPGPGDDYNDVRTNTVTVSADQPDLVPANNQASEDITVSGFELDKLVCNISLHGGSCNYPADYVENTIGEPGDILEYRIAYSRYGTPAFDAILSDNIPTDTEIVLDAYSANTEVALVCPNGALANVETGSVAALHLDLANECVLNTATRNNGIVDEALLQNESGYFLFRVKIK